MGHFNNSDHDKDGYLGIAEFVMQLHGMFGEFVPHVVLSAMGLAKRKIVGAVLYALLCLGLLFFLISLVIQAFTKKNGGISVIIHSFSALGAVVMVKRND